MKNMDLDKKKLLVESLSNVINEQRQLLLQQILSQRTRHITVVLEDIYQAQNASAVIRTAECIGLQEIHIIENKHEYQLNRKVLQGASKWMEINRHKKKDTDNTSACLKKLKKRGYKIVAMTLHEDSVDLDALDLGQKLALCFGSEQPGLTDVVHEQADEFIKIPMCGFTQSFNISVSAGISLYQLSTKMRTLDLDWQLKEEDKIDLYIDWLSKSTPTGKVLLNKFIKSNAIE
jgi:tRNA (guanosine-2'-O-)-methyltransferase